MRVNLTTKDILNWLKRCDENLHENKKYIVFKDQSHKYIKAAIKIIEEKENDSSSRI